MTGNNSLVTIIIPLYNAEKYIEKTIQSVIIQTYRNWELLVVDDCSTDRSTSLVNSFEKKDSRIKLIKSKTNFGGPAYPRNIGIDNAKGEYIAFLDADDLWTIDKLKIQVNLMINNNLNFTSTNATNIDMNTINIDYKYRFWSFLKKRKEKYTLCDLIKSNFIATSSVIIKREIIPMFDENIDFISVEDFCLWLDMLNRQDVNYKYLSDKLLKYRILSTSISERGTTYKQVTKANLCILKFVLKNNRFDILNCYYFKILNIVLINTIKKIIGR
jgi:teichuronic acid biosynthesis glycosyltransferase TuaG